MKRTAGEPKAKRVAEYLAGISVQRKYPPEILPRVDWEYHHKSVADWDKKSDDEKSRLQNDYYDAARLLEANQILRRPPQPATGLVISADGYILTSAFNVGDDVVYKDKKTGKPNVVVFKEKAEAMITDAKEVSEENNAIEKIFVTLRDGERREAKLVGKNLLLGVALLKIEATGIPHLDLKAAAVAPKLGSRIGLLGFIGGSLTPYTLNLGIISATHRNNGRQCQTDALLNYGNAGGPVFNSEGKFLGIADAPISPRTVIGRVFTHEDMAKWTSAPNSGVSMIARADVILTALDDLKAGKNVLRLSGAAIGIALDPARMLSDKVIAGGVEPGSGADKAGIAKGDRIVSIDGQPIASWRELTERIIPHKPGDKVEIVLERKDISSVLLINEMKVNNQSDLQALMKKLKPGEKFEGTFTPSDVKTVTVTLGERK